MCLLVVFAFLACDAIPIGSRASRDLSGELPRTYQSGGPIFVHGVRFSSPHTITWEGHALSLNGIQVWPEPEKPNRALPPVTDRIRAKHAVHTAAWDAAKKLAGPDRLAAAQYVYDDSPIVDSTWTSPEDNLTVRWDDSTREEILLATPGRSVESKPDPYGGAQNMYSQIKAACERGSFLSCGWGSATSIRDTSRVMTQVRLALQAGDPAIPGPLTKDELEEIVRANRK